MKGNNRRSSIDKNSNSNKSTPFVAGSDDVNNGASPVPQLLNDKEHNNSADFFVLDDVDKSLITHINE